MGDETLRLRKLIEHWLEHNEEHRARLEEAAREASEKGLKAVAESLKGAEEEAAKVIKHLRKALDAFE